MGKKRKNDTLNEGYKHIGLSYSTSFLDRLFCVWCSWRLW